jgi:hypothetical protein
MSRATGLRIERIVSSVPGMINETNRLPPTEWSDVVTAVIQYDRTEGTNMLLVYSADEQLVSWSDLIAIGERAAMLEATSDLQLDGYKPIGRTWLRETDFDSDGSVVNLLGTEPVRSFRRASAKGAK